MNCDPTYELEEMIIEAKPLHKKKKRLAKQNSKRENAPPSSTTVIITDTSLLQIVTRKRVEVTTVTS